MSQDTRSSRPAQQIGDYLVQKEIAISKMGRFLKARQQSVERDVALLEIAKELTALPGLVERTKSEISRISNIHHENLVECFGMEERNGAVYIIMEYYTGHSAQEILHRKGSLPTREAINIIMQAATGLESLHAHGIPHGMIKPANIIISDGGIIKLKGLGVWNILQCGKRLLTAGSLDDMHFYLSTEQCSGSQPGLLSDVYGLGATFFHLVSGRTPFLAKNPTQLLIYHKQETPIAASAVNTSIPASYANLISRMMRKMPSDRPSTSGELIAELDRLFLEEMRTTQGGREHATTNDTARQRHPDTLEHDIAAEGLKGLRIAVKNQLLTKTEAEHILRLQQNYRRGVLRTPYPGLLFEQGFLDTDALCKVWRNYHLLQRTNEDKLFGKIAVINGLIHEKDLRHALSQQKTLLSKNIMKRIGEILQELGHINQQKVDAVLGAQSMYIKECEDRFFGKIALSRNFVTQKQLQECLAAQKQHPDIRIGDLLSRNKYLPNQQKRWILDEQARLDAIREAKMFGKIAVHLSLLAYDDMVDTLEAWEKTEPVVTKKKIWEILLERAYLTQEEIESLRKAMVHGTMVTQFQLKTAGRIAQREEAAITDSHVLMGVMTTCPNCGKTIQQDEWTCPFCMQNIRQVQQIQSKRGTQRKATKKVLVNHQAGPWQMILPGARSSESVSFSTLVAWIHNGHLKHNSSVRGPTTKGQWQFALEVQGLAREFGVCHQCHKRVDRKDTTCRHCKSDLLPAREEPQQ